MELGGVLVLPGLTQHALGSVSLVLTVTITALEAEIDAALRAIVSHIVSAYLDARLNILICKSRQKVKTTKIDNER